MREIELNERVSQRMKRLEQAEAADLKTIMKRYQYQRTLILETYLEAMGEEAEGWRYVPNSNVLVRENGTKEEA